MTISFPKYSFVQAPGVYDSESCYNDPSFCLPLSSPGNLRFQARFNDVPSNPLLAPHHLLYCMAEKVDFGAGGFDCRFASYNSVSFPELTLPYVPFIVSVPGGCITIANGSNWDITAYFDTPEYNTMDDYNAANEAALGLFFKRINPGDCFRLIFIIDEMNADNSMRRRTYMGCSNCFKYTPASECYTSVIEYRSAASCFDFDYTDFPFFYNRVELPVYLRDPVMNDDTKIYTKSDGSVIKLYERKEEQYMLETDTMPYTWLKALDIAVSHDTITITNPNAAAYDSINTATQFVKKDSFDIEYQKGPLSALGKGNCKLLNASPVHLYNNNCG